MVGQRESPGIFVSGVKAKELMIIGSSLLLFLFQWENKNDFITIGSLIFSIQIKMSSDLLCPTLPYQMNHLNSFIDNEFLESGQSFGHFSVLKTPPPCLHHYDYLDDFCCFFLTKSSAIVPSKIWHSSPS